MISGFLLMLFILQLHAPNIESSGEWGYSGGNGPSHWAEMYPTCAGKSQSPIDFKDPKYDESLGKFTLSAGYSADLQQLDFKNNGHSVVVSFPADPACDVSGGGLPNTFRLAQFHMHWGSTDCRGSEHTVNGKLYPLEIHYVHYNTKYPNFGEAASKSDGLAVLGVFVDVSSKSNANFEKLTRQLANVKYSGSGTKLPEAFKPISLLPDNKDDFMRYSGSLTTPECGEVVTWTVFNNPIYISHTQMNSMRGISFDASTAEVEEPMVNNYRPTLPLNGRIVQKTFSGDLKEPSDQDTCAGAANQFKPAILALTLIVGPWFSRW